MGEAMRTYQRPSIRMETDLKIVLECLFETYAMEGEQLLLGKSIYKTMVCPFLKMLEIHCDIIYIEEIHSMLWEIYQESGVQEQFIRCAEMALKPYRKQEDSR